MYSNPLATASSIASSPLAPNSYNNHASNAPSSASSSSAASAELQASIGAFLQQAVSPLDRPLPVRQQREVSLSSFVWLFNELIAYSQARAERVSDIEVKLTEFGFQVGQRTCDLSFVRASPALHASSTQRPKTILLLLQHIHGPLWKQLFGRTGDGLEKSTESEDEYYIYDNAPITNRFLSIPKDLGDLNCAAFIAGIIKGLADTCGFPCEVTAHFNQNGSVNRSVFIIKFDASVLKREAFVSS